jgi:hypothetical protein
MSVDPLFQVHKLNEGGLQRAQELADRFNGLLVELNRLLPEGREFSIVKTKLEEAAFFAKKAIAKRPENQAQ